MYPLAVVKVGLNDKIGDSCLHPGNTSELSVHTEIRFQNKSVKIIQCKNKFKKYIHVYIVYLFFTVYIFG